METITVRQLRDMLADKPGELPVKVWLPGSRLLLGGVTLDLRNGEVLIEGNVAPGSTLEREVG